MNCFVVVRVQVESVKRRNVKCLMRAAFDTFHYETNLFIKAFQEASKDTSKFVSMRTKSSAKYDARVKDSSAMKTEFDIFRDFRELKIILQLHESLI